MEPVQNNIRFDKSALMFDLKGDQLSEFFGRITSGETPLDRREFDSLVQQIERSGLNQEQVSSVIEVCAFSIGNDDGSWSIESEAGSFYTAKLMCLAIAGKFGPGIPAESRVLEPVTPLLSREEIRGKALGCLMSLRREGMNSTADKLLTMFSATLLQLPPGNLERIVAVEYK